MQSSRPQVYPSAVDTWLMVLLYSGPAILIPIGIYSWLQGRGDIALTCLLTLVALILINRLLTWPCRYTLTDDSLNIRCGLLFRSVPLDQIQGAELSSSWESAPALSLRRVRIRLDRGYRIVSPIDREAFIADLMTAVEQKKRS